MFSRKKDKQNIKNTIQHMFSNSKVQEAQEMIDTMDKIFKRSFFRDMEYNWYSYVPALWHLQRFNEANSLRNFTIIPQGSPGRRAIRIDTKTMTSFVNSKQHENNWKKFLLVIAHWI